MEMHHNDGRGRKKSGKGKRGSTNNAARLDRFAERTARGQADWGTCSSERLQGVVVGITELGGAVTFGLSRDQGAHSLTLLLDGGRQTLWFNGDADLTEELGEVMAILEAMA